MIWLLMTSGFLLLYWANVEIKKKADWREIEGIPPKGLAVAKQGKDWEESYSILWKTVRLEIEKHLEDTPEGWFLNKPSDQKLLPNEFVGKCNAVLLTKHNLNADCIDHTRLNPVSNYLTGRWMKLYRDKIRNKIEQ